MTKVEAVSSDIHNFIEKANPVLQELADVSQRANKIVTEAENYWEELDSSIKKLKEKVSDIRSLNFFRDAENPAKDLIKNLKAFSKGFSAFWQAVKRN
jgi:ABC-type transporter Mla subunit MlaD